jgi:hypothetical protein
LGECVLSAGVQSSSSTWQGGIAKTVD